MSNTEETPLHLAASNGDLQGVKKFLKEGSDPNVSDKVFNNVFFLYFYTL
jgi:ankyrin repeat protein